MISKSTQKLLLGILIGLLVVSVYTVLGFMHAHMFIRLPGGYGIYQGDYGVALRSYNDPIKYYPAKFEVGPNIGGYRVYYNVIVGQIDNPPYDEKGIATFGGPFSEIRMGYFIIDLRTKMIYGGLSRSDWMKKLKPYGITEEPNLHTPSWLDKYFGWNMPADR